MNKVQFDLLRVLIAVGDSKNFREAAGQLGISQPAVSFKLRQLELQQGMALFNLEGKRKVLTRFGRALYDLSKARATDLDSSVARLRREYADENLLTVRIGGRSEVLDFITPLIHFGGRVELVSLSSREAIEYLRLHKIDIAISHVRPDSNELYAKRLFQSKTYFAIHRKFLKNKKLSLSLIQNQDFLRETPSVSYLSEGQLTENLFKRESLKKEEIKITFVSEDWHSVLSLIEQGRGYGVLPSYILSKSSEIEMFEIPDKLIPQLGFYAIFETSLRKIKAFQNLLKFES